MVRCRGSRQRQSPGTPLIRPGIPGSQDPNIPSIHYISTPSFLRRLRAQSRFYVCPELPREACTRRARYLPDVVFFPTFYCTRGLVDATTCPSTSISYAPGALDNDPRLDFTLASNEPILETGPTLEVWVCFQVPPVACHPRFWTFDNGLVSSTPQTASIDDSFENFSATRT